MARGECNGGEALRVEHDTRVGSKAGWDEIGDSGRQRHAAYARPA
ncbi:MAG: hypothetical protein OEY37_09505 [Gammaproteobacteria bacterium]|nr:hypothetical protein [Gammaproteobacteria bacterium]MDH5617973.1 hypothetical protein [Gammaproteobacteria bacterium]